MKLADLNGGDTIKFKCYETGEDLIGILDHITPHGDFHVYRNTSNTHRQWYKILSNEILARIRYVEDPIEI
jgi:hypothetical protein